jgi:hypothetical protein
MAIFRRESGAAKQETETDREDEAMNGTSGESGMESARESEA